MTVTTFRDFLNEATVSIKYVAQVLKDKNIDYKMDDDVIKTGKYVIEVADNKYFLSQTTGGHKETWDYGYSLLKLLGHIKAGNVSGKEV